MADDKIERTTLGDAIDKATLKMLQEAYLSSSDKNVIMSPLSVMILLSLYNTGAGKLAREQIGEMLGGGDYKELAKSYSGLCQMFSTLDPDCLTVANKMYVDKKYNVNESFEETARTDYGSEIDKLNFANCRAAADIINKWAEDKTRGHIKKAVDDGALSGDVASVLVNVIFFQGHWHVPFNASDTKDKDFHAAGGNVVKKPMMYLRKSLKYTGCSNIPARMIELPYQEEGFRMIVVLPDEIEGLPTVVEHAAKTGLLDDIFNLRCPGRHVILDMPKFNIETSLDLKTLLREIGLSGIFSEKALGIVKGEAVKLDKAFQKAFVKVDEEGAVAGAFTGMVKVLKSIKAKPPTPIVFNVDRPFLFMILHEDKTLFAGTLSK